ncbi:MAG: hypothetical protein ACP5D7_07120, partial [Limnospira sp.]
FYNPPSPQSSTDDLSCKIVVNLSSICRQFVGWVSVSVTHRYLETRSHFSNPPSNSLAEWFFP